MNIIDIDCFESAYYFQNYCYVNSERLLLGKYGSRNNIIYLYFRFPCISDFDKLVSAKLILFKTTLNNPNFIERRNIYCISPLLVYFSTLSCMFLESQTDYSRCVYFEDRQYCLYEEADLTCICKAWINNDIENRGLLINGVHDAAMISLSSEVYPTKVMRPIIRLTFEDICINKPLRALPCNVDVYKYD